MKTSVWQYLHHSQIRRLFGWALLILITTGGCTRPMSAVRHDLATQGYVMWYPAEAGIEPGQIWLYDGTLRKKFADKPAEMSIEVNASTINSRQWAHYAEVDSSFEPVFTNSTISKAGPLAAELHAATVYSGTIQFGSPRVISLSADSLSPENLSKLGPGYTRAIELVREGRPGLHLVGSVVVVDRVTYTLNCEDPYLLVRQSTRIRSLVAADMDVEVLDAHGARLTFRPKSGTQGLVIGVLPIRGNTLEKPIADARRAMGAELQYAAKQNYAFPADLTLTVVGAQELIEKDDTADTVDEKYRRATVPKAVASSGNELPPAKPAPAPPPEKTDPLKPSRDFD